MFSPLIGRPAPSGGNPQTQPVSGSPMMAQPTQGARLGSFPVGSSGKGGAGYTGEYTGSGQLQSLAGGSASGSASGSGDYTIANQTAARYGQPTGQATTPNMFNQASQATSMGMAGAMGEMGYRPMMVDPSQYNVTGETGSPMMVDPSQYGAMGGSPTGGYGGGGASVTSQQINPMSAQMEAAQTTQEDISRFFNPYTTEVVDTSLADIERARQMQQNAAAAQAQAAGAFGGSRGALMESEVGRNALDQAARTAAQLRQQGFTQAVGFGQQDVARRQAAASQNAQQKLAAQQANQQAALQAAMTNAQVGAQRYGISQQADTARMRAGLEAQLANQQSSTAGMRAGLEAQLANQRAQLAGSGQRLAAGQQLANIGNLGFGQAQDVQANMQQQGAMQQALQQQLINAAQGQYGGYTGFPAQSLGYYSQALGASQIPQNQTTSRSPGLFDYLTLGASIF